MSEPKSRKPYPDVAPQPDFPATERAVLEFWERELTDAVIVVARAFDGPPEDRILNLMVQVIDRDAAVYDPAISVWAKNDPRAKEVFERALHKRFDFARWMFKQCGFSDRQAGVRGRLMVAYLMGETAADLKSNKNWKAMIREKHGVLTNRSDQS